MKERMKQLLLDASKCFEELSSPFSTEWLAANNVTLDECGDLSEAIASAIKLYVALPVDDRINFELKRAINESDLADEIKRYMNDSLDRYDQLQRVRSRFESPKKNAS